VGKNSSTAQTRGRQWWWLGRRGATDQWEARRRGCEARGGREAADGGEVLTEKKTGGATTRGGNASRRFTVRMAGRAQGRGGGAIRRLQRRRGARTATDDDGASMGGRAEQSGA
jgi:hypothetical protein